MDFNARSLGNKKNIGDFFILPKSLEAKDLRFCFSACERIVHAKIRKKGKIHVHFYAPISMGGVEAVGRQASASGPAEPPSTLPHRTR